MPSVQLNVNNTIVLHQDIIKLMRATVIFRDLLIVYVVYSIVCYTVNVACYALVPLHIVSYIL
jgi:hypothetical protein